MTRRKVGPAVTGADRTTHLTTPSERPTMPDTAVARRYTLTITCRRPRNRASDDWFIRPAHVAKTLAIFVGGDAEMTFTPRTVRLRVADLRQLPDVARYHGSMAVVMDCLRLDVHCDARGECQLPSPVRTEIRETHPA
jgi:hypothetical protein